MNNLTVTGEKAVTKAFSWDETTAITQLRKKYKTLTDEDFYMLCQHGVAMNLNPWLNEIHAIKYGNSPAQIIVGIGGYMKNAESHPQFLGLRSEAIFENTTISFDSEGAPVVSRSYKNRGKVIGAIAWVYRADRKMPIIKEVEMQEYNSHKSIWATKPITMIKKVAESQALRSAFPNIFNGTYTDDEYGTSETYHESIGAKRARVTAEPRPRRTAQAEPIQGGEMEIIEPTPAPAPEPPQEPEQKKAPEVSPFEATQKLIESLSEENRAEVLCMIYDVTGVEGLPEGLPKSQYSLFYKKANQLLKTQGEK